MHAAHKKTPLPRAHSGSSPRPMMKRTTHADEMNRCAPRMRMMSLLLPSLTWCTKCFPPFLDRLVRSLSGLILFDGKMNVIIARKNLVAHFQERMATVFRSVRPFSICRFAAATAAAAALN